MATRCKGITRGLNKAFKGLNTKPKSRKHAAWRKRARVKGSAVDKDIERVVNNGEPDSTCCADAKALLDYIREKRWKPVAAQYYVRHPTKKSHTWIDLLCQERTGPKRWVVVEIKTRAVSVKHHKTTYSQYLDRYHQTSSIGTPNTRQHRDMIQALRGRSLFIANRKVSPDKVEAVVLVVCKGQVFSYVPSRTK